jgi:mono/diheme cytochrome c family protein
MKTHLRWKNWFVVLLCALALASSVFAGSSANSKAASAGVPLVHLTDADSMRVGGEQRFRANCGRCHAAPQKFPPRMMGTILRHMRVRATITDEDRRLILFYLTQ